MRQVHAGRETEAVPRSGAGVNKVKNNQVRVGPRLSEGAPAQQQQPRQRNNTSLSTLEITSSIFFPSPYLESALISSPHSSAFFSPLFVFLFICSGARLDLGIGSPARSRSAPLIIPINHLSRLSLGPLPVQVYIFGVALKDGKVLFRLFLPIRYY